MPAAPSCGATGHEARSQTWTGPSGGRPSGGRPRTHLPGYLNNLGLGLRARYARSGRLEDLEEALEFDRQALATLDRTFLLSPVAYQLGQQAWWAGLVARAVAVHHQARYSGEALAIAEGSKSRLLTVLLSRRIFLAPAVIPPHLAQEQALATELADLDAADLARHGRVKGFLQDAQRLTNLGAADLARHGQAGDGGRSTLPQR